MNRAPSLAAVALVLVGTQGPQTKYMNGNLLVHDMQQYEQLERHAQDVEVLNAGIYVGYVLGVADAFSGQIWCPGGLANRVTAEQLASTVAKYLKNNPEQWHLEAAPLVMDALNQAFPCKK